VAYLTDDAKISIAVTPAAGVAAQTAIDGTGLDMAGYDSVSMIVAFGVIDSGAATSIKAQQSDDNAGSDDYSDITGTAQTVGDTADNKVFVIDLHRPTKRWVRLKVLRATQDATVAAGLYIQHGARTRGLGSSQGTNVAVERFVTPAEGTA
jgi:hypothetical protein